MFIPYTTKKSDDDFKLATVDNAYGWKISQGGDSLVSLENLARDLPMVEDNANFERSDISVPSPWAALISYDIVLENKEGDYGILGEKARNEWKSLITLIALRDVYKIDLKAEIIDLKSDFEGSAEKEFYSNLLNVKPKNSLFGSDDCWDKLVFIKLDGYIIGVFSNSSLVCPCYRYEENVATKNLVRLGFMDAEYNMKSPLSIIKGDFALVLYISKWLDNIKRHMKNSRIGNVIGSIIDDFIGELKDSLSFENKTLYDKLVDTDFYKFVSAVEPLNSYELLWNSYLDSLDLTITDVKNNICMDNNTEENAVFLLEALGEDIVNLKKRLSPDKCKVPSGVFYDSIFLDKLTLIRCGNGEMIPYSDSLPLYSIVENEEKKVCKYILPINNKIISAMSNNFADSISAKQEGEDVYFSIKISIAGSIKTITKKYTKDNCQIIGYMDLPLVAIYPYAEIRERNETTNLWKDYYVFTAQKKTDIRYRIETIEDNGNVTELSRIPDNIYRTILSTDILPSYLSVYDDNSEVKSLGVILLPPPAIYDRIDKHITYLVGFDFGTTATTAFCKREGDISDAIKFIKFGEMVKSVPKKINVSVRDDFDEGTYIGDNKNCMFVAYNNPKIVAGVFNNDEDKKYPENNEPDVSFVPSTYPKKKGYMSLYNKNTEGNIVANRSLQYGNIIFDQRLVNFVSEDNLIRNLKWGTDQISRECLSGYLSQIMKNVAFTLACEGAYTIKWRFSYPTALGESERKEYKITTENIVDYIGKIAGIQSVIDSEVPYCPESVASAKFHAKSATYMCIDIGGGSSDISLWKEKIGGGDPDIIMQFSVGIASRKIFLSAITDAIVNPKEVARIKKGYVLNDIQKEFKIVLENSFKSGMEEKLLSVIEKIKYAGELGRDNVAKSIENFAYIVESLLNTEGIDFKAILRTGGTLQDDDGNRIDIIDRFEQYLVIGFWGIMYYAAKSLVMCRDALREKTTLIVNFAGNGSKLCDWLERGGSDSYFKAIEKAFEQVVNDVLERTESDRINVSFKSIEEEELKTEAATGLLELTKEADNEKIEANICLINGIDGSIKNGENEEILSANASILESSSIQEYYSKPNDGSIEFNISGDYAENLKEFLSYMNNIVFKNNKEMIFDLSDSKNSEIKKRLNRYVNIAISNNRKSRTVTPAFIVELEALLRAILGYYKEEA